MPSGVCLVEWHVIKPMKDWVMEESMLAHRIASNADVPLYRPAGFAVMIILPRTYFQPQVSP